MLRTLLLSLVVVGTAVAVVVGAVTALADKGGPGHGVDHGVANGLQDEGGADVVEAQDNDNGNDGEGAEAVAQAIADAFDDVSQEDVLALHEEGIGFGAIFKLYLLAAAGGTTVEALMSEAEADGEFAFGERFKELAGEVSALTAGEDGMPKNLGGVVSEAKKADAGAAVAAANGGDEDGGHGPPDGVPAHGRN